MIIIIFFLSQTGVKVIKLCSMLGAQQSCWKQEIQHFEWMITEYEYNKLTPKFNDFQTRSHSVELIIHLWCPANFD